MKLLLILLLLPGYLSAQHSDSVLTKWRMRVGIYYSSENNVGNLGFTLKNEFSYQFQKSLDVSILAGVFHSVPALNLEPKYFTNYSSIFSGISLNHTLVFDEINFVRSSAGLIYTNWNNMVISKNISNGNIYYTPFGDEGNNIGYILGLEGGRQISKKMSVGLQLSILSYQIFGDIIMLGVNCHFKL